MIRIRKMSKDTKVQIKAKPIIEMLGVTVLVTLIIVAIDIICKLLPRYEILKNSWVIADLVHIPQFLVPFLLIYYITKGKVGEYGFNLKEYPPVFTHRRMLIMGIFFGLLMSLRYIPQFLGNMPLDIPRPVTLVNIVGNMTFQWVIVGLCEETMFRGLIQTYLMNNLKGYVRIFGHDLHIGTVFGAIFWGGFHFINIIILPLKTVIFIVILTTIIGLPMGYAYQKTGSLLTTIIVHNMIFGVPLTIGYILYWLL
jgi:membrane protease YdiL (CAAX protease family)